MKQHLFQNVSIIDPDGLNHGRKADLLVEEGVIKQIAAAGSLDMPQAEIHVGGCVSPGWVDMRCHLSAPGREDQDDLHSLAKAGSAGGFTRLLLLPNTHPAIDHAGMVKAVLNSGRGLSLGFWVSGCLTVGAKGKDMAELFDMQEAGAMAFTDGLQSIQDSGMLLRALQYTQPFDGLIVDYPFDAGLAGNAEVAEGVNSTMTGMKGIPDLAEEMGVMRTMKIWSHDPHRLHLGPITTDKSVHILRKWKDKAGLVTFETSALYLLLNDGELLEFNGNAKVWPPLRNESDVQSIQQAVREGVIDVISSSHHPQSPEDKTHDFADASYGAEMLETAFAAARTALPEAQDVEVLVRALAIRPREVLKVPVLHIAEGAQAELTWFDPELTWTPQLQDIRSKSKNNPLLGRPLKGKPLGTYFDGAFFSV